MLRDGRRQLIDLLLVEGLSRLIFVGLDLVDIDIGDRILCLGGSCRRVVILRLNGRRLIRKERVQASAQSSVLCFSCH